MSEAFTLGERRYRDAVKAMRSLEGAGFMARLAGGCVRDRLRGDVPKDYDVATSAKPTEVMRHFQAIGWRTIPTGLDHGTVTLVLASGPVEITTLRVDVATDGRHAEVAFGTSFEEDAARRDFTFNAMFEDAGGVVYDYFGGQADLAAGILRFVGEPRARMREDYLRILRLFRFWSRFGFSPAPGTLDAVRAEVPGIVRVSQERITSELKQLVSGLHAPAALQGVCDVGLWGLLFPEAPLARGLPGEPFWAELRAAAAADASGRQDLVVLSALLLWAQPWTAKDLERLGGRLKMSSADSRAVAFAPEAMALAGSPVKDVAESMSIVDRMEEHGGRDALSALYAPMIRALAAVGAATGPALAGLASLMRTEEALGSRRRARLPLDGHAVMRLLGLGAGPELGALLDEAKRAFRNGAFATADEGLAWVKARAELLSLRLKP